MSDFWQETISKATQWRQEFHQYPELAWQERRTAERIRQVLTDLGIPWEQCADTGTLARLNMAGTGPHIALRGDIDALPITEQSNKSYESRHQGCMHACGHDGHTATLLAAARWLKQHETHLSGPVTLVFQPAEEGGHGAQRMIEDGALTGVDEIYGWHNWPAVGFGRMVCPDDAVMCGNGVFTITVNGRGGHASQPELCRDPVLAASAIVLALQQVISRRLAPQKSAVLSVTSVDARSGATVIPQTAVIGGSIRIPDQSTRDEINHFLTEITHGTAKAYGVTCDINVEARYNATVNHAAQAGKMRECWQDLWGAQAVDMQYVTPIMASEDFSYYLQAIPGAFAIIGSDDGPEHQFPCHSPHYDFNDRLIERVVCLYAALVGAPSPMQSNHDYSHQTQKEIHQSSSLLAANLNATAAKPDVSKPKQDASTPKP